MTTSQKEKTQGTPPWVFRCVDMDINVFVEDSIAYAGLFGNMFFDRSVDIFYPRILAQQKYLR